MARPRPVSTGRQPRSLGTAGVIEQVYSGQKVVFDTTTGTTAGIASVLDRASFLSILNGGDPFSNRIVVVLHGQSIPYFATRTTPSTRH